MVSKTDISQAVARLKRKHQELVQANLLLRTVLSTEAKLMQDSPNINTYLENLYSLIHTISRYVQPMLANKNASPDVVEKCVQFAKEVDDANYKDIIKGKIQVPSLGQPEASEGEEGQPEEEQEETAIEEEEEQSLDDELGIERE